MNPINYARGLLAEIATGAKERVTAAKAELATVIDHLRAFDVDHLDDEVKALKAAAIADVEAVLPKAKPAAK